jgi:hypothetical protein
MPAALEFTAHTTVDGLIVIPPGHPELIDADVRVSITRETRPRQSKRIFGRLRGKIDIAPDFDAGLPEDILSAVEK